jgi:hypothetical protein
VYVKNFHAMYPFEGYVIETVSCGPEVIHIGLRRDGRRPLKCPDCCRAMATNRETTRRCYDLFWGDRDGGVRRLPEHPGILLTL